MSGSAPAAPARPATRRHRADVEGLRALAILAVVAYHAGLPVRGGFVGVDVFFVVSGFLITGLLWRELSATGRVGFGAFYARRVRRLLPAATLVLLVTVLVSIEVLPALRAREVIRDAWSVAVYAGNYRFAATRTDYLGDAAPSPLQHFWSLAVEEQFYLVWPVLLVFVVWLIRHRRRTAPAGGRVAAAGALAGVAVLSLALSVWLTRVSQPWAFFSLPSRAWELAVGGLLALAEPGLRRLSGRVALGLGWCGLAALVTATLALSASTPFPGLAALLPVLGTAAVLAAGGVRTRGGPEVLLRQRPAQVIGEVSYSWYLWHWPPLVLAPALLGHPLSRPAAVGLMAAAGVAAAVTLRLVEDPLRFAASLRRPGRALRLGAGLTVLGLAVTTVGAATLPDPRGHGIAAAPVGLAGPMTTPTGSGGPNPLEAAQRLLVPALARAASTKTVPANLTPSLNSAHADKARPFVDGCFDSYQDDQVHDCIDGDVRGSRTVVLFGDSHAAQWFPALDQLARNRHWRLITVAKTACPPIPVALWQPDLHRPYHECASWRARALRRIRSLHPSLVVVGVARHYGPEWRFAVYGTPWLDALGRLVTQLRSGGAPVLVLGATPHPSGDMPVCLSAHLGSVPNCAPPLAAWVNLAGEDAERAAVTSAGGHFADVWPWLCTRTTCPPIIGDLLVYRDDNHLTTEAVNWLAPVVATAVDLTLRPALRVTTAAGRPRPR